MRFLRSVSGRAGPILTAVIFATLPGCSLTTHRNVEPPDTRYLTIFLIDGLANDVFTEELNQGRLPNIDSAIGSGAYVNRGITTFPSVSGFALYPFLTGRAGSDSELFGLRWFDRSRTKGNFRNYIGRTGRHFNADLGATPTIFEQLSGESSVAYNSMMSRGVRANETLGMDFVLAKFQDNSTAFGLLNGAVQVFNGMPKFGLHDDIATTYADVETKVVKLAMQRLGLGDRVQLIVFTTLDNISHLKGHLTDGEASAAYVEQLWLIDTLIGEYRKASARAGTEGRRVYLITSDHGVTQVDENISVVQQLEDRLGLVYDRDMAVHRGEDLNRPLDDYLDEEVDVVQALQGNRMSYFYFKNPNFEGPDSWHRLLSHADLHDYPIRQGTETVDLVQQVASMEGIGLVVHKSPSAEGFLVTSTVGVSEIRRGDPGTFSYRVVTGEDPLGYEQIPFDVPIHEDEWLRLTYESGYPYAVPLLGQLMSAHPDADLIVTTRDGFDHGLDYEFVVGNYRGGHGGLDDVQMIVPFILSGSGVRTGSRLPFARSVDVGNTLQQLMGIPPAQPQRVLTELLNGR
jgi:hypothetical protein